MITSTLTHVADAVRHDAIPLTGGPQDFEPLLQQIGDARFVLIGEASHGTHDFYRVRAELTKRLIREKGFHAVAVEADWPDAYRVNRYVRGTPDDPDANDALGSFRRFPTWMWRNADVLDFVGWLRSHNEALPRSAPKVGFYGLDLYSLYTSIEEVLRFLDRVDPEAAARARARYGCFERFEDPEAYGYATSSGNRPSCEPEAVAQLVELQRRRARYSQQDGRIPEDELFYAEQNARLIRNAEMYYRSMFGDRVSSWNLRDQHMTETLEELAAHLDRRVQRSKLVVWEHNSHLGDARATELGAAGEWNVGQLVRARYPAETFLIGFTTYSGTVTAASAWGGPAERKVVRPALEGSVEALFHDLELRNFLLLLKERSAAADALHEELLERAIGVIYLPETERQSHYFHARLAEQFDAVLHYDQTRAIEPLERTALWQRGDLPETYPIGI